MGGRGSTSGGATGGLNGGNIVGTDSLVSMRELKPQEVDQVLGVARDIRDQYGVTTTDLEVATIKGGATMAYYDFEGNLAINESYFDAATMSQAYDACVASGFHPGRGNKTGLEAVTAHELGHRLTDVAGEKLGDGKWALDKTSNSIIAEAKSRLGANSVDGVRSKISGYAKSSNAEAVAEAFADVYCNGSKASKESQTVVNILSEYLRR